MSRKIIGLICSITGTLGMAATAPPTIGFVKSNGEFRIDGSGVRGNGTLFEGNVVETLISRSTLRVGVAQLTLLPESRAKVYHDRIVLEKGISLATNLDRQTIDVSTIHIGSTAKGTQLQVEFDSPSRVVVAASSGSAEVRNSAGLLVANVIPGAALAFDTRNGGASSAVTVRGKLQARDGEYFLTDRTANITIELKGTDLERYTGKTVEISGSFIPGAAAMAGASQVVQVVNIKVLTGKAAAAAAGKGATGGAGTGSTAAGAGAAGAGAAGAGLSTVTIGVIVGGVAVGGTVAGMAAAGTFSGSSSVSAP